MVHPLGYSVVRRPGRMPDLGDVLAAAFVEQPEQLAADVLRSLVPAIRRIRVEGLEVGSQLLRLRLVAGEDIDLRPDVVVEHGRQPEDPLGLTDLGGQVALVPDRDSLPTAATLGNSQRVGTDNPNRPGAPMHRSGRRGEAGTSR